PAPDPTTSYPLSLHDALPIYGVGWLEEPFPAHDYRSYQMARGFGRVPLAAGENHYTRFEFTRVVEDGAITVLQPDLSKTGGPTEDRKSTRLNSSHVAISYAVF